MIPESLKVTLSTCNPEETMEAGEILGRHLRGGEIIALEGPLASGKTTLIRGLARGLDIPEEEISSPTFVYIHEHRGRVPFAHIDLFRTGRPEDIPDLGLTDYLETSWVLAVEWAEKAAGFLPENRLTIRFTETENNLNRTLDLTAFNPDYQKPLKILRDRFCVIKK